MIANRKSVLLGFLLTAVGTLAFGQDFLMFDRERVMSMGGDVREFQWTNPHCWVQVTVKDDKGLAQEYSFETLSRNILGRMGWKHNTLKPGDKITAFFNPPRDGSHGGYLVKIQLADGSIIGEAQ